MAPAIRNVVFDIGNVLVRWDSLSVVKSAFGLAGDEADVRQRALFGTSDIWRALNRGEHSEAGAMRAYVEAGLMSEDEAARFVPALYDSLEPLSGTPELMERLDAAGYRLFALTDNVREIVAHLRERHAWWSLFEAATVSAELGCLKPDPRIYAHVLESNGLAAAETVFFDDLPGNVAGAKEAGMHAFVFTDAARAERDLASLGVDLRE